MIDISASKSVPCTKTESLYAKCALLTPVFLIFSAADIPTTNCNDHDSLFPVQQLITAGARASQPPCPTSANYHSTGTCITTPHFTSATYHSMCMCGNSKAPMY